MADKNGSNVQGRTRMANQIYETKLKAILEPAHTGKVVAIDIDSGSYYLGKDALEACHRGRAKQPGTVFVCRRVGQGPLYRVGAF